MCLIVSYVNATVVTANVLFEAPFFFEVNDVPLLWDCFRTFSSLHFCQTTVSAGRLCHDRVLWRS